MQNVNRAMNYEVNIYCLLLFISLFLCMSSNLSNPSKYVIIGGGIHGASLAYYLTLRGIQPLVIERVNIAAAASGKSGGFLAKDWGSGPTIPLHKLSFDLHRKLATELGISSFRDIDTLSVNGMKKGNAIAPWLDGKASSQLMDGATAQVTPLELTNKLMETAILNGAELVIGEVQGLTIEEGIVKKVKIREKDDILVEKICITAGPWSSYMIEDWFDVPLPMEGIKSTSIVYQNNEIVKSYPYACFCDEDFNSCHLEIYPRNNGDIYICGIGGSDYVRGDRLRRNGDCESADLILPDPQRVQAAKSSFGSLSASLGRKDPDIIQACMRPCTSDGLPVMSAIPGVINAFVSTGHNCWGILWAPISGLCMAELMTTGVCETVDLLPFRADRFMASKTGSRGKKRGVQGVGEQW